MGLKRGKRAVEGMWTWWWKKKKICICIFWRNTLCPYGVICLPDTLKSAVLHCQLCWLNQFFWSFTGGSSLSPPSYRVNARASELHMNVGIFFFFYRCLPLSKNTALPMLMVLWLFQKLLGQIIVIEWNSYHISDTVKFHFSVFSQKAPLTF